MCTSHLILAYFISASLFRVFYLFHVHQRYYSLCLFYFDYRLYIGLSKNVPDYLFKPSTYLFLNARVSVSSFSSEFARSVLIFLPRAYYFLVYFYWRTFSFLNNSLSFVLNAYFFVLCFLSIAFHHKIYKAVLVTHSRPPMWIFALNHSFLLVFLLCFSPTC